jgi:hypothetical protein
MEEVILCPTLPDDLALPEFRAYIGDVADFRARAVVLMFLFARVVERGKVDSVWRNKLSDIEANLLFDLDDCGASFIDELLRSSRNRAYDLEGDLIRIRNDSHY